MLRSIAELAAYGTFAVLLTAASLVPATGDPASSAATSNSSVHAPASTVTSARGALLFATKGCVGCHTHASLPNARMQVGPDLTHLMSRWTIGAGAARNTPENLRAWVDDPSTLKRGALMPAMKLSRPDLDSVTAYLVSLR